MVLWLLVVYKTLESELRIKVPSRVQVPPDWLGNGPHLVACCVDGHVRVIDGDNVTVTQDRAAIEGWAYSLAVHPTDGSIVVGGAEGQVKRITLGEKK